MNFRNQAIRELLEFPNSYSLGDVLYSVLQSEAVKNKTTLGFLRKLEDEEIYTLVQNAKERENE